MLRKIITALVLSLLTLNLGAQALVPDRYFTLTVDTDYKYIFHGGGVDYSVGYSADLDYHLGPFSTGVGFDNGISSYWLEDYNVWFNLHAGYSFGTGKGYITPYLTTGWFLQCWHKYNKRYDYLLSSAGCRLDFLLNDYTAFDMKAGLLLDHKLHWGAEVAFGLRFKF